MTAAARRRRPAPAAPWAEAVAAIVRGSASLPGALCRGDSRFTSDDPADQAAAVAICQTCPELIACTRWRGRAAVSRPVSPPEPSSTNPPPEGDPPVRDYDFPALDAPRTHEHNRVVISQSGVIDPYLCEVDNWCSMPVRLVTDQANGFHLEIGPYGLDISDINVLRRAIAAYDEARQPNPKEDDQ